MRFAGRCAAMLIEKIPQLNFLVAGDDLLAPSEKSGLRQLFRIGAMAAPTPFLVNIEIRLSFGDRHARKH